MSQCPAKDASHRQCTLEEGHGKHIFDLAVDSTGAWATPPAIGPDGFAKLCPVTSTTPVDVDTPSGKTTKLVRRGCVLPPGHGAHVFDSGLVAGGQRPAPPIATPFTAPRVTSPPLHQSQPRIGRPAAPGRPPANALTAFPRNTPTIPTMSGMVHSHPVHPPLPPKTKG
jgi:hypothetical protein